ncbi:MAG: nucleotidyltransferase [Planctomycetes bacterium RBG_13_63_9]|nr:MAG: nucleotidyltransferase [Planctomycetes bacterium RBG_13_63_9]
MSKEHVLKALKHELPFLQREFGVRRIGVFGSCARAAQTDASDVDIVAEFERPIGLRFVEFAEYLERIVGRRADVLTPAGISSIRNRRIAKSIEGSVVYV